jgi:hypothetical protein
VFRCSSDSPLLRVVYIYYILSKVRCLGVLVIPLCYNTYRPPSDKGESLENLNTSLYREYNKYRPPSDKGVRVVYIYCILCKVRCLGVLVIPLCLRVVYIYTPKHITLQSMQ